MRNVLSGAMVIARRDFVATVMSRSFILFLLAPLFIMGFSIFAGQAAGRAERDVSHPVVAVVADSATVHALEQARARLTGHISERSLPRLRAVAPAEHVDVQARRLVADQAEGYSAVFTGTIDQPALTGPASVETSVGGPMGLLVEEARRDAALGAAGTALQPASFTRTVTAAAAGDERMVRRGLAQGSQMLIFMITLMLATLLLSNLVEEKSSKVIEVLAASVPLDSVFLGKLLAMLATSLVGLLIWGSMLGLGFVFFEAVVDWAALPAIAPSIGWPLFALLLLLYYTTNYLLLGGLFLGIGGQANSVREVQSLSMPVTFLQLGVLLLAMRSMGGAVGATAWTAFIFPFSSPLSMIAFAAQDDRLWPHAAALVWQAVWAVVIVRLSARMFRATVLKSGGRTSFLAGLKSWGRAS